MGEEIAGAFNGHSFAKPRRKKTARWGLLLFVLLLSFDGSARKWGLASLEQQIFVIKDLLLIWLLLMLAAGGSKKSERLALPRPIVPVILFYCLWVVLSCFNPLLPNMLVGLWGVKAHLLYIGIAVLISANYSSPREIVRDIERIYPLIVIPVCTIALLQVGSGVDSALNASLNASSSATQFGDSGHVRVSGTFSYTGGMAAFLQSASVIGFGLLLFGSRKPIFVFSYVLMIAALPVAGSRVVVVGFLSSVLLIMVIGRISGVISIRKLLYIIAAIISIGIISLITQYEVWTSLYQRAIQNSQEGYTRLFTPFTNAFKYMGVSGLSGYGVGSTNTGALAFTTGMEPFSWLPARFEEESGRLVLEIGIIGWLLSLIMRALILIVAIHNCFVSSNSDAKLLSLVALPFMVSGVYVGTGIFVGLYNPATYWLMVGILALASRKAVGGPPRA